MSFWNKVSGFFGKVWNGIKKGVSKVGQFLGTVGKPLYNAAKPLIGLLPGGGAITSVIDSKVMPVVDALSSQPKG